MNGMNASSISRRLRALAALLCAALVMTLAAAAVAQTTIRDELPPEAQKDWDAAKELFEVEDYRGALIQFQRAYERSKNPRVLYNVGVCWKNLSRYAQAISAWEKELAFRARLSGADIQRAEQAIEALRPYVSTVVVQANQPGATLFINGDEVGKTPFLAPVPIDVGRQTLTMKKLGFLPAERVVDIARGTPAKVDFELEPAQKQTAVSIAIKGARKATIFVDGVEMGKAPFSGMVPAGRHTFEARSPGFETARQTSIVEFGRPLKLTLALVKERPEGRVRIVTDHTDAVIEIDGKVVGSGAWEGVLPAGGHQLLIRKQGFDDYRSDLALSPDQDRRVAVKLERASTTSWIWWTATTVAVVAGGSVASYFVFRPAEGSEVSGTLPRGPVTTVVRF
jgi:hypothetical protein